MTSCTSQDLSIPIHAVHCGAMGLCKLKASLPLFTSWYVPLMTVFLSCYLWQHLRVVALDLVVIGRTRKTVSY